MNIIALLLESYGYQINDSYGYQTATGKQNDYHTNIYIYLLDSQSYYTCAILTAIGHNILNVQYLLKSSIAKAI